MDLDRLPNDLKQAVEMLLVDLDDPTRRQIQKMSEVDFRTAHHKKTGVWIRNSWSLWTDSMLRQWFEARGVYHPDDMSGVIFTSLYRTICNKPIRFTAQVEQYKAHWKIYAPKTVGGMCGKWKCSCGRVIATCRCGERNHTTNRIVTKGCKKCRSISRQT